MCLAPVVGDADAMLKLKAGVIASSTLAAATVLWLRQTPMATLRVESFGAAVEQVAFGNAPTFAFYIVLARSRTAVVGLGVMLTVMLTGGWWFYATDPHSTAALGPGFSGWLYGPMIVVGVRLLECAWTRWGPRAH